MTTTSKQRQAVPQSEVEEVWQRFVELFVDPHPRRLKSTRNLSDDRERTIRAAIVATDTETCLLALDGAKARWSNEGPAGAEKDRRAQVGHVLKTNMHSKGTLAETIEFWAEHAPTETLTQPPLAGVALEVTVFEVTAELQRKVDAYNATDREDPTRGPRMDDIQATVTRMGQLGKRCQARENASGIAEWWPT